MKKLKIMSAILIFTLIFGLVGNVFAALSVNYNIGYNIKDNGVEVTVSFTNGLPEDYTGEGWTEKDAKTITKEMMQGAWDYITFTNSSNTKEIIPIAAPLELEVGEKTACNMAVSNYESSNPSILKIEDGMIVAVKAGEAKITGTILVEGQTVEFEWMGTVNGDETTSKDELPETNNGEETTGGENSSTDNDEEADEIEWTDASNIKITTSQTSLQNLEIITNLKAKENRAYYIYISKKSDEKNITSETEGIDYLTAGKDGNLRTYVNKNIKNITELSGKNYVYIVEKMNQYKYNYQEKLIVSGVEIQNPSLPSLGNRLDIWLYDANETSVSNKVGISKDRKITYKIGKITSNDILKSFKNESSDVAFSKLLDYAKKAKYLKEGKITVDGLDTNIVSDITIDKDGYYFVYMIADTNNGKYVEVEDVAIYQENNSSEGNILVHFSFADIKVDEEEKEESIDKKEFNGNKYYIFEKEMTWEEAKKYCESQGGHLVTVTSKEEQEFIEKYIKEKISEDKRFWMGATDAETEGTWKWITDEKFDYNNWGEKQPDNLNDQDYALIQNYAIEKYGIKPYGWDDIKSNEKNYFICEWDKEDDGGANEELPQAGMNSSIIFVVAGFAMVGLIGYIGFRKYKEVK